MRLGELAQQSGLTATTVKYYLREGLLPPGRALGPRTADYDETHLRRLRMIRALREVGGLTIDAVREIVRAVDDPQVSIHEMLGAAQHAATGEVADSTPAARRAARELAAARGWTVRPRSHGLRALAAALEPLQTFGHPVDADALRPWADAADLVAAAEVRATAGAELPRDVRAEFVALGTVLYGALLAALRLLAEESASAAVNDEPPPTPQPSRSST